jgi:hypothetical protein
VKKAGEESGVALSEKGGAVGVVLGKALLESVLVVVRGHSTFDKQ